MTKNEKQEIKYVFKLAINDSDLGSGICKVIEDMYCEGIIPQQVYNLTCDYLDNNLPEKMYPIPNAHYPVDVYCWGYGKIKPRQKWLKQQINKLR